LVPELSLDFGGEISALIKSAARAFFRESIGRTTRDSETAEQHEQLLF